MSLGRSASRASSRPEEFQASALSAQERAQSKGQTVMSIILQSSVYDSVKQLSASFLFSRIGRTCIGISFRNWIPIDEFSVQQIQDAENFESAQRH